MCFIIVQNETLKKKKKARFLRDPHALKHRREQQQQKKKHVGMKGDSLKMRNFSVSICKNVNNALQLELKKFWTKDFI